MDTDAMSLVIPGVFGLNKLSIQAATSRSVQIADDNIEALVLSP